ncbi:hypothetical protein PENSTE_c001G04720 [Penicillium steckii]|uniref:Uncharacterized protein n=1 Tax=Penicillium steckii TaxID=303698 RepID=A0A1V6TZN3_9EURO|nr:hypothetical protein PENSTE_c001G04720 [Penicillium steckii]
MTQLNVASLKSGSCISIDGIENEKMEKQCQGNTPSKKSCATHGSSTPLIDRELHSARGLETVQILSTALNDLTDGNKCTKCTIESLVTLLVGQLKEVRLAKQNGEWSKEDKKTLKAETKFLFKPAKKSLKEILKGN